VGNEIDLAEGIYLGSSHKDDYTGTDISWYIETAPD